MAARVTTATKIAEVTGATVSTVRRGFQFNVNKPRVHAHSCVPVSERSGVWYKWLKTYEKGIKGVSLRGVLKKVWNNENGIMLILAVQKTDLCATLKCDVAFLEEYPDFVTFIPWGESDDSQVVNMKVKNKQASPEIAEAFMEGILLNGEQWAIGSSVSMLVNVTMFCNFPNEGDMGLSFKMVTPPKITSSPSTPKPVDFSFDFGDL